jgi:uncharacterized FlaG/YvyC family protein
MKDINTIAIEGRTDFVRDLSSKALLSCNKRGLQDYKLRKKNSDNQRAKLDKCVDDINSLRDEIDEIKSMLKLITSKFN